MISVAVASEMEVDVDPEHPELFCSSHLRAELADVLSGSDPLRDRARQIMDELMKRGDYVDIWRS